MTIVTISYIDCYNLVLIFSSYVYIFITLFNALIFCSLGLLLDYSVYLFIICVVIIFTTKNIFN